MPMHKNILTQEQVAMLPLVNKFTKAFGLVGGTAVALQIGHRRSIDFDLFTLKPFVTREIKRTIRSHYPITHIFIEEPDEVTLLVNSVKMTFYRYPYPIEYSQRFEDIIAIPDLLTLAAMKAFALGGRAKWKDYVDLYFIFKNHSLFEVTKKTKEMFGGEFNEKLFREQLSYFQDINYSEEIEYMPGFEVADDVVKNTLQEISLQMA